MSCFRRASWGIIADQIDQECGLASASVLEHVHDGQSQQSVPRCEQQTTTPFTYLLSQSCSTCPAGQEPQSAMGGETEHVRDSGTQPVASTSGRQEPDPWSGPAQIGIIMGSDSDLKTMAAAEEVNGFNCVPMVCIGVSFASASRMLRGHATCISCIAMFLRMYALCLILQCQCKAKL